MYIKQAFNVLHDWWRYLIGLLIIITAIIVGQIPLTVVVIVKALGDGKELSQLDESAMMGLLEPNWSLFLMLLSFAIGLIGVIFVVKFLHKQSITQLTTARPKIDWKRFWFSFWFWGILSSAIVLLDYFYLSPDDYVFNFKLVPFLILCIIAIIMIPLQTSFEEYLFRGYLMQGLGIYTTHRKFPIFFIISIVSIILYFYLDNFIFFKWYYKLLYIFIIFIAFNRANKSNFQSNSYNQLFKIFNKKWIPLITTSLIFGLLHIANPEVKQLGYVIMVYYVGTGLFLGIMTLMDDGLELALGFHAANNLFTALLVSADWTAFQTHSIFKDISEPTTAGFVDVFMPVFVLFPILLFIFAKKYNWTNWQEKLLGKVEVPIVKEEVRTIDTEINNEG